MLRAPITINRNHVEEIVAREEAERDIIESLMIRLQECLDGERDFDDAIEVEEFIVRVSVRADGTVPRVDALTSAPVRLLSATLAPFTAPLASLGLVTAPFFSFNGPTAPFPIFVAVTAPLLSFGDVTALFLSCGVPTLLLGKLVTA